MCLEIIKKVTKRYDKERDLKLSSEIKKSVFPNKMKSR